MFKPYLWSHVKALCDTKAALETLTTSVFLDISGLKPRGILLLGRGFVREEWKTLCFKKGLSVTEASIQSVTQFAQKQVSDSLGRILDRSARVELLKQSLKDPQLRTGFPILLAHRFRPGFYDSLDQALQKGREFFAHAEEARVLEERLLERLGFEGRREEFFLLNQFWERVLEVRKFYDESRVLQIAAQQNEMGAAPTPFQRIYLLEHFLTYPRLRFYLESLVSRYEVIKIAATDFGRETNRVTNAPLVLQHKIVHSLEDGAHYLLDAILEAGDLDHQAVVIEDLPEVRRTLKRVAEERGLCLQDPRDPTLLIQSEEVKSALLELEIVARNYPSPLLLPWVSTLFPDSGLMRKKMIESGATQGYASYAQVPGIEAELSRLKNTYPSRMTLTDLFAAIQLSMQRLQLPSWVNLALTRIFSAWTLSLSQMGLIEHRKPLRYWLEELNDKIKTSPPLVNPQKNLRGLKLFRVDQAISADLPQDRLKIHFFGISQAFFDPREQTSEWFSARDIEVLSKEFSIPGQSEQAVLSQASFISWCAQSTHPSQFWEHRHNEDGNETESLALVLNSLKEMQVGEAQTYPVHPKVLPSLGSKLSARVVAQPVKFSRTEFPMSFLSSLGNCAFTAYAQHLLSLYDERDPDFDLSGDTFGNLVHAAVEYLVSHQLRASPEDAFDYAWANTQKLAWLKSDRLFKALRYKTLAILFHFVESERDYRVRSGAEVIDQEMKVSLHREGFIFSGRVDRIDQHADGIVLMDYKTSGLLPSSTQTLEVGKGLQLPAYALALKETLKQEVVSAHYVHLAPLKTNRNIGFLFSKWNKGKIADKVEFPLSTARGNSGSLLNREPAEVWEELDRRMIELLKQAKTGVFHAIPSDVSECKRCRYQAVCGKKRDRTTVVDEDPP